MDTLFKITAVLGALAWMPQIIKWIVSWLRKPKLNIICDNEAQVGYIAFGSVLNVIIIILRIILIGLGMEKPIMS